MSLIVVFYFCFFYCFCNWWWTEKQSYVNLVVLQCHHLQRDKDGSEKQQKPAAAWKRITSRRFTAFNYSSRTSLFLSLLHQTSSVLHPGWLWETLELLKTVFCCLSYQITHRTVVNTSQWNEGQISYKKNKYVWGASCTGKKFRLEPKLVFKKQWCGT